MGKTSFVGLVALGLATAACSGDPSHPANLVPDGGGSGGGGSGGTTGKGGTGGTSCQPNANEGVKVSGDLIVYDILMGAGAYPGFNGKADIYAEGVPCGWAKTSYDGTFVPADGGKNRFLLEGVKTFKDFTWFHFYEQEDSFEPVYATLIPVATAQNLTVDGAFGFIRSTDVQKVYADTGTAPDPDKATVVAQVIDLFSGKPYAGAQVATAVSSVAAYPFGGSWSIGNAGTATDPSGVVVFMNVDSLPFPGSSTKINVTANALESSYNAVVETGAVTIIWLGVGFST